MLVTIANLSSVVFLGVLCKKEFSFKKSFPFLREKCIFTENSNAEGCEHCYMLLIFLLLT